MGWLYGTDWQTKDDMVRHLTRPDALCAGYKYLDHAVRGNTLYMAVEKEATEDEPMCRFINVALMAGSRRDGWGYKAMDETYGPRVIDCPLRLLKLAQPAMVSKHGVEWRKKVREYHEFQNRLQRLIRSLKVGSKVYLWKGCAVEWVVMERVSKRPLQGRDRYGTLYRIKPSLIDVERTEAEIERAEAEQAAA